MTDAFGNVVSQTKYKAWGEVRYSSGASPTDITFTGQKSHVDSFGLMFYQSRYYDPSLSRFVSADTIVPGGVQGYDRYAYTANNPLRYTDPTGHRNCEEDGYGCDRQSLCSSNWANCGRVRETYVLATIKYHGRYGFTDSRGFHNFRNEDKFDSFGPAQVSDIEMETPYGVEIKDEVTKDIRKTGLGLRNGPCKDNCAMDQDAPDVAVIAMRARLTLRLDVCMKQECTVTDMFIVAAISADEQIHPSKLNAPRGPFKNSDYESADPATTVNWQEFINANWKDPEDRQNIIDLIHGVQAEVMKLQEDGYYVPGVQWGYVTDLK